MSTRTPARIPAQYRPLAIGAVVIVLAMVVLGTLQLATRPTALRITPQPTVIEDTEAPVQAPFVPTRTPVLAPTPRALPSVAPEPSQGPSSTRLYVAPQTGKGMTTLDSAPAVPAPVPDQPVAAPPAFTQYLANVAAQSLHSPRANPAPAPVGGDYVVQPTAPAAYQAVIEGQAQHKVR